jgi:putative DNA primase/helicase
MSTQNTTVEGLLPVDPDGIPDYLKIRPQWVCWIIEERNGKPTKVPVPAFYYGGPASTTDLLTWTPFHDAYASYEYHGFCGIGFVLCSADPFVGIDFDGCRNPETGEVDEDVLAFVAGFAHKYVEVSPTGTGLHLITRGSFKGGKRRGKMEMYGQDRFFTITGVSPDA